MILKKKPAKCFVRWASLPPAIPLPFGDSSIFARARANCRSSLRFHGPVCLHLILDQAELITFTKIKESRLQGKKGKGSILVIVLSETSSKSCAHREFVSSDIVCNNRSCRV